MSGRFALLDPRLRTPVFAGSAIAALLIVALTAGLGMAWVHAATLAALLVILPALSLGQIRVLESVDIERIPAYVSSILTLVVVGGWSWFVASGRSGSPALGLGLHDLPVTSFAVWTVGLTLAGLVVMVAFRQLSVVLGLSDPPLLRQLLPRTSGEKRWFMLLSLAAGMGEEMAYRGYAIPMIASVAGVPAAVGITSFVFGILHVYQGVVGIVRTAVLGGLLAFGFLASGSLLPAIAAHALLDVVAGLALGERLLVPEPSPGVPEEGGADEPS